MAELFMNLSSGVLSADPGAAGTTLASGNFAFLPAIAAPNYMRLVLNPDGIGGVPEIVIVTAHTGFATTCTVLRGQETAFGAGPAVAHAIDTIWRHSITRQSLLELAVQPGVIQSTIAPTPDVGFVFLDGSTIAGGQTLYPLTWARIPAAWKAAPDIHLPDWRGLLLIANDAGAALTLGATAGSNTHTLTQAELPAATIAIDPPSTTITVDPPATAVTGSTAVDAGGAVPVSIGSGGDLDAGCTWVRNARGRHLDRATYAPGGHARGRHRPVQRHG